MTLILTLYPRKCSVRDSHKKDALTGVGLKGFDVLTHAVGALFFHARRGVRIGAEREGCGGMTKVFLNGLDVVPSTEAVHRERVPERMKTQLVKPIGLHQPLKAVVKGLVADIAPQLVGEDQLIGKIAVSPSRDWWTDGAEIDFQAEEAAIYLTYHGKGSKELLTILF